MSTLHRVTGIIKREDDGYVAFCPKLDIANLGTTVEKTSQ
jgi:predicted RNase H-like HicB family nuclease